MKKTENLQSPKNTRLIDNSANAINLPLSSRGNSVSNTYLKEKWIRSLIQGIFLKLGYLTSDIIITKNSVNNINLIFLYYPLSQSSDSDIITGNNSKLILIKLINLIKLILQIKEPSNNYKLIAIKASNKLVDSNILNDYFFYSLLEDPNSFQNICNSTINEFKSYS